MAELSTREAVHSLLYDPDVYSGLTDAEKSSWRSYRKRYEDGILSTDKVEELLSLYGYRIIQERLWREPKVKKKKP